MKIAISKRACVALPLSILALTACADEATAPVPAPTGAELVEQGWEPATVRVVSDLDPGDAFSRELDEQKLAAMAEADPAWRAKDGRRFTAMFVSGDGRAYGRVGEAPELPAPSGDHGAFNPDDGVSPDALDIILGGTLASDRRVRYSAEGTLEAYPYRTVGALSGSGNTQSGGCTATMVGPRHLLTASHCVLAQDGSLVTSGFWNPGQTNLTKLNGGESRKWTGLYYRDWRNARRFDYALLFLEDRPETASLGWMGIAWWNDASGYSGKTAYNKGYPCGPNMNCGLITNQQCLASPRSDDRCDGWMYGDSATLSTLGVTGDGRLEYDLDTSDGHSGSAIYTYLDGVPAVLAVHYGPGNNWNAGARFRDTMWNDVCDWIGNADSAYATHSLCVNK